MNSLSLLNLPLNSMDYDGDNGAIKLECQCMAGSGLTVNITAENSLFPGCLGIAVPNLLKWPNVWGHEKCILTTSLQHCQKSAGSSHEHMVRHLIHKLAQHHVLCLLWMAPTESDTFTMWRKETTPRFFKRYLTRNLGTTTEEAVSEEPQTLDGSSVTPSYATYNSLSWVLSHRHNTSIHKPHVNKR